MEQSVAGPDVAQESVAETLALAGPLHQACKGSAYQASEFRRGRWTPCGTSDIINEELRMKDQEMCLR